MRKILAFMMVTLDGYFEGPNQDIDWHVVDQEFNEFAEEQLNSVDTLLFGRVTYQGMAAYWPTAAAMADDPIIAAKMNQWPKIVFSQSLDKADWQNTRLVKENVAEEIRNLKQQPGKDMIIFGSGNLLTSFTQLGLIDEYRIMVNPVALGKGVPLFQGVGERVHLRLLKTRSFRSGNVLLFYEPVSKTMGSAMS